VSKGSFVFPTRQFYSDDNFLPDCLLFFASMTSRCFSGRNLKLALEFFWVGEPDVHSLCRVSGCK